MFKKYKSFDTGRHLNLVDTFDRLQLCFVCPCYNCYTFDEQVPITFKITHAANHMINLAKHLLSSMPSISKDDR